MSANAFAALTAPGSPFEIEELPIRQVPTKTWKHAPRNLRSVLLESRKFGDLPFVVYENERLSFEEHFRCCAALGNALVERLGVRKGDRVAIAMRNYPEWPVAFWAALAIGAVVVPINAWLTAPEIAECLRDSASKVLVADDERIGRLVGNLGAAPLEAIIAVRCEREAAASARPDDRMVILAWSEIVSGPAELSLPGCHIDPDDDATISYTSGTTGVPKGVVGTHRNLCTNLVSVAYNLACQRIKRGEPSPPAGDGAQKANLLSAPLFHVTGSHSALAVCLHNGTKLVLMYRWDPERAMELIERERVTVFGGVPTMAWQVVESPSFHKYDLSSVERVAYGGAPAPAELVRRLQELLPGAAPSIGYGMTETSAVVSQNVGDDYRSKPESVGLPVPVCEVRIVDADGKDVPSGTTGQLWVKGPNVARGYWNNPEETRRAFSSGWLHTGDIGRKDEDGFLYILDRMKDMLIRGGENIFSIEVENALYSHPAVLEAAVLGVPHRVLGEEVGAVVRVRPGLSLDKENLKLHVAPRLAAYKVPVHIRLLDEPLPRNPSGKILKAELRSLFE